jgi:hypothetical protein
VTMKSYVLAGVIMAGAALSAADMSGTVSAAKGLQMNGQVVPVAGTKSWPVASGDVLKSDAAPAVVTMKDGSKLILGKNSQAKLEDGTVRLLNGTMQYELTQQSKLQVAVKNDVLPARTGLASTVAAPVAPVVTTQTAEVVAVPPPVSRRKP